jgi:integrase
MEPKRAKVLTPAKFRHLLRVREATSRFPERDTLILLLGVTCGMRITEIARFNVRDVLAKSGRDAKRSACVARSRNAVAPAVSTSHTSAQSLRSTAISNGATSGVPARLWIDGSIVASCPTLG